MAGAPSGRGISSHNPKVAKLAAMSGYVEMILFSINPAYDMLPASEDIETLRIKLLSVSVVMPVSPVALLVFPLRSE